MRLFRPVGPRELAKIRDSGMRAFPPRLASQPIFYPVLDFSYAEKIARDWNSTAAHTDFSGFVTAFAVEPEHAGLYPVRNAGGAAFQELWVPAEELEEFNRHIVGLIEVIAEYQSGERLR